MKRRRLRSSCNGLESILTATGRPNETYSPGIDGGESSLTQRLPQTYTGHRRCDVRKSTGNREGTAHGHMIVASAHRRKPAKPRTSSSRGPSPTDCAGCCRLQRRQNP